MKHLLTVMFWCELKDSAKAKVLESIGPDLNAEYSFPDANTLHIYGDPTDLPVIRAHVEKAMHSAWYLMAWLYPQHGMYLIEEATP